MGREQWRKGNYMVMRRAGRVYRFGVYVDSGGGVWALVDLAVTRWGARRLMRRAAARYSGYLTIRSGGQP